jgi:ketosteroid isomerase-like protein
MLVAFFDERRNSRMRGAGLEKLRVMFLWLLCSTCLAQGKPIEPAARRQIDAGNKAWIDGMKQGSVGPIAATYTPDAVDCNAEGDCIRGRVAIEEHMKQEMTELGKADMASVTSIGSVAQGRYIYEWGQAEAHFPGGRKIEDRYLTAWQKQSDGAWEIFRNLVIPNR